MTEDDVFHCRDCGGTFVSSQVPAEKVGCPECGSQRHPRILSPSSLTLASDLVDEYLQVKPQAKVDPASLSIRELAGCWIRTYGLQNVQAKFQKLPRNSRRGLERKWPGFQRLLEQAAASGKDEAPS